MREDPPENVLTDVGLRTTSRSAVGAIEGKVRLVDARVLGPAECPLQAVVVPTDFTRESRKPRLRFVHR